MAENRAGRISLASTLTAAACRRLHAATITCVCLVLAAPAHTADVPLASAFLAPTQVLTRIAFGSCFRVQQEDDRVWSAILDWEPQLFLFAGDTLYPDEDDTVRELPNLRASYERLQGNAAFSSLRARTPVWPIWDDHDYGRNDAGGDFPFRRESEALFLERWGIAGEDPRSRRPGLYHSRVIGAGRQRVQIIVLDTRFFRSPLKKTDAYGAPGRERYLPDPDPAATLLGEAQWQWLARTLKEPAELRILVSSIQVLAEGHGWESWRNLPRERSRLFSLLGASDETPILIFSGDRHVAGFYQLDIGRPAPLLEFTSSALNNPVSFPYRYNALAEAGPHRLGALFGEPNFGGLIIDWESGRLTLDLRDALGNLQRRVTRTLDQHLQPIE